MNTKKVKIDHKNNLKQEIIYSAIVEKELLHNGLVQREQLKTLKELNVTIKDLTFILNEFKSHEFLQIHQSKWKIALYNLVLGMLFAIGTVLGLLFLSWSTFHLFKDSEALKNIVNSQLSNRQFNVQEIKDKADKAANNGTYKIIKDGDRIKLSIINTDTGTTINSGSAIK